MSTDEISNIVALELLSPHLSLVSSSNVIIKFYYQIEKKQRVRNVRREKPAGASAMTWSSTYVSLVLLILPNNNLTCLAWMTGS